jgi:PhzF family phenazine biosynthesis protein
MSPKRYFIIDAFAERPFTGNPAAVVLLDAWPADDWLQNVAMEMNLAETAFVVPREGHWHLRWFTPKVEVKLCGHATVAAAKAMQASGQARVGDVIAFDSLSGHLTAAVQSDAIELDFPVTPAAAAVPPPGLLESLRTHAMSVARSEFDFLVEVTDEATLRGLKPDFAKLALLNTRGVIVTAPSSNPAYDFVSRFFAPSVGIDEDPVTGSAHCCLVDYWQPKLGKDRFTAFQASARGGVLHLERQHDRVKLCGGAIIMASGQLHV